MSTVALETLFPLCRRKPSFHRHKPIPLRPFFVTCSSNLNDDASFIFHQQPRKTLSPVHAVSHTDTSVLHSLQCPHTITNTFLINTTETVSNFPSHCIYSRYIIITLLWEYPIGKSFVFSIFRNMLG